MCTIQDKCMHKHYVFCTHKQNKHPEYYKVRDLLDFGKISIWEERWADPLQSPLICYLGE